MNENVSAVAQEIPHPLDGVRVLDIGEGVAGPFCARLLARLGAEVIKIEPPGKGDPARRIGPYGTGRSAIDSGSLHLYVNEGKYGITLDLESHSGKELFHRLVSVSQVVVESHEPDARRRLGVDYDTLSQENQRLVLTSISSFGLDGPYRDFKSSELTVFAMGGHVYKSGRLGRPPLRMGGYPGQYLAAVSAAAATLFALRFAERDGPGQQVDFSIFESQVTSHAQAMVEVSYYGEETAARAPRGAGMVRQLMAGDGPAMLSVQEHQMRRVAELVGAPAELGRPNPMAPGSGRAALQEYITRWAASRSQREVYEQGQAAHLPASYVATPADLLQSPQYRHRGFLMAVEDPELGRVSVPGLPFGWPGAQAPPRPAPRLGQDNASVYGSLLGLSRKELQTLFAAGVV